MFPIILALLFILKLIILFIIRIYSVYYYFFLDNVFSEFKSNFVNFDQENISLAFQHVFLFASYQCQRSYIK